MPPPIPNLPALASLRGTPGVAQQLAGEVAPFIASAVVLKQLTGPEREIVLYGPCLPFRGLELGTEQRHVKTELPGAPVAPIQVLGVSYPDTSIEGRWTQERVGIGIYALVDDVPITSIRELVRVIELTVAEGQHLKFSWDVQSRVGLLVGFYPKWNRAAIVDWTMNFVWQRGAGPDYRPFALTPPNPARAMNWLDTAIQAVGEAIAAIEGALAGYKTISNMVRRITTLSLRAQDAIRTAAKFIITPVELATEIINATTGIIAGFQTLLEEIANNAISAVYSLTVAGVRLKGAVLDYQNWNINAVPVYPPTSSQATSNGAGGAYDRAAQTPQAAASSTKPPKQNTLTTLVNLWPLLGPVQIPAIYAQTPPEVNAGETVETVPLEPTAAQTPPDMGSAGPPGGAGGGAGGGASAGIPGGGASAGIPGGGTATGNPQSAQAEPFTQGVGKALPLTGFSSALSAMIDLRLLQQQIREARDLAAEIRQQAQARIASQLKLKGVWYARSKDDLRDVAQHFYNDQQRWRELMLFNKLANSLLTAGQVVLAPERLEVGA